MTHTEIVHAFVAACEALSIDGMLALMTPDVRYLNVGMGEAVGHEQVRRTLTPIIAASTASRWTLHHVAESESGAVLTERTDEFEVGGRTISIPVMGVFEFRDGRISALRDYFDVPALQKQMRELA